MTTETSKIEAFMLCMKQARGDLGRALTADDVANAAGVPTLIDVSEFSYTKLGSNDLDGLYVWRYNLPENDAIRRVVSVAKATGTLTLDGPAWTDVDDLSYILIGFDPRKAIDAMDAGYERVVLRKDVVLTIGGVDLDCERDDTSYWDQYMTNVTVDKIEGTPENKVTGDYVLSITLSANNGYLLGPRVRAVPGDKIFATPCLRVETGGPFTVRLWDTTHSAYFGETQSYQGAEFAYLFIENATVPAGCDFWQYEIRGTASGDVAWLDSAAARAEDDARFTLTDSIDETYKLPLIHRMRFTSAIQGSSDQHAATKRKNAGDLVLGTHYQVEAMHTEANRYVVAVEETVELGQDVLYLATRRQRDAIEPWEFLTDPTTAPRGELIAYLMYELCDLLEHESKDPYWARKRIEWGEQLGEEVAPRAEVAYTPERTTLVVKV